MNVVELVLSSQSQDHSLAVELGHCSQVRPMVVPDGPVQAPPFAVSLAPTTGVPEIVGAAVTSTSACAGTARPSASTGPSNAILILLPNNSPPPCGSSVSGHGDLNRPGVNSTDRPGAS